MTRLKLAELTSGIGALVLGVGLGALFAPWFAPAAGLIAVAGVAAHGFGMWDKHHLEAQAARARRGSLLCTGSAGCAGGRGRTPVRQALRGHAHGDSDKCHRTANGIRTAGATHQFFPLCDELDELNVYTRRYHHGENPDVNRANKMTASFTAMCAARWN